MKRLILLTVLLAACTQTNTDQVAGPRGLPGSDGHDGTSCQVTQINPSVVLPTGGALVQCGVYQAYIANGAQGATGNSGTNGQDGVGLVGPAGPQGDAGVDGQDGIDTTPIIVVNLCPGVTTYPSIFIETALCISGNLYGVYSANGGFLTYLAPGNWSSNAIGSACSLTIGPNCTVSH